MKYAIRTPETKEAVRVILQANAGMSKLSAAKWALRIDEAAITSCGAVWALEVRCRMECASTADAAASLVEQLQRYEAHIELHSDPLLAKPNRTLREETFQVQLDHARSILLEEGKTFAPSATLLTELSLRNALYDALENNYIDVSQPLKADRIACRNCAYTLAVWMRDNAPTEADLTTLALRAAALDRLGYLDPNRIARLHAAIVRKLEEAE